MGTSGCGCFDKRAFDSPVGEHDGSVPPQEIGLLHTYMYVMR